jgi:hypothetical protein
MLYHDIGSLFPDSANKAQFAQIWVTGGNDKAEASLSAVRSRSNTDPELLLCIQRYLSIHNTYA